MLGGFFSRNSRLGVLYKKVFLKISWNSQANLNFIKKENLARVLFCEFCEIFKNA